MERVKREYEEKQQKKKDKEKEKDKNKDKDKAKDKESGKDEGEETKADKTKDDAKDGKVTQPRRISPNAEVPTDRYFTWQKTEGDNAQPVEEEPRVFALHR